MEQIFTNARIVLRDRVVDGAVLIRDGVIEDVSESPSQAASAIDLDGDLLAPGFVELHTDNVEKHLMPRPGADWPPIAAVVAHDAQIAAAGITTVFDAMAIGDIQAGGLRRERLKDMVRSLRDAKDHGLLKADHLLHLRCEISDPQMRDLLDPLLDSPDLQLISVMDHTPGQRQFVRIEKYRDYYQRKFGLSDAEIEQFIDERMSGQAATSGPNRRYVVERARSLGVRLASHDDATLAHVDEAVDDGMTIAEFPTTVEAADASHRNGMAVMMGGPNLVRGGSHSGNVSAMELARHGILDVISSDYAPGSLLHGAMMLAEEVDGIDIPAAIATVSKTPAEAAGLSDRGEIAVGKRADLVRIKPTPPPPAGARCLARGRPRIVARLCPSCRKSDRANWSWSSGPSGVGGRFDHRRRTSGASGQQRHPGSSGASSPATGRPAARIIFRRPKPLSTKPRAPAGSPFIGTRTGTVTESRRISTATSPPGTPSS